MTMSALESRDLRALHARVDTLSSEVTQAHKQHDVFRTMTQQRLSLLQEENSLLKVQAVQLKERVSLESLEKKDLQEKVVSLTKENLELTQKLRRAGITSQTSSQPPSSDKPHERAVRTYPTRERSQEKQGRAPGTPGTVLELRTPDKVVVLTPSQCRHCHADLTEAPILPGTETRQVTDVEVRVTVTQYQGQTKKCTHCATKTVAEFPREARARTSYGPGLRSAALEMSAASFLPLRSVAGLCSSLLGITLTHASVQNWVTSAAGHLRTRGFETRVTEVLQKESVLHADETPISLLGSTSYVHVLTSSSLTYFFAGNRSREAIVSGGVLGGWNGTLVSDDYVGYKNLLGPEGTRQLCWAHLLRALTCFVEAYTPSQEARARGVQHPHPVLAEIVTEVGRLIHLSNRGTPDLDPRAVRELIHRALEDLGEPQGQQDRDLRNLLTRLRDRDSELWHFLEGKVPPTNNLAEQAVRSQKTRLKRSGSYQSKDALHDRLLVMSYLETLRKQGKDTVSALRELARGGEVWLPEG